MGNSNLTELWNLCPDNFEACSAPERDFLPILEDYFREAVEQLNPEEQVEDAYKKVNDGSWGWRALRLMSRKSPHFFTYGNNPIAKLPDYLDQLLKKMLKDNSLNLNASFLSSETNSINSTNGNKEDNACTAEMLTKLAEKIAKDWKKLVPKLGLTPDDVKKINDDGKDDDKAKAKLMLDKWVEIEGEGATKDEMMYILEGLKMGSLAEGILSS